MPAGFLDELRQVAAAAVAPGLSEPVKSISTLSSNAMISAFLRQASRAAPVDRGDLRRSAELFASGFEQLVVDVHGDAVMALTVHQLCDKTRTKINSEWCLAARRVGRPRRLGTR